MSHVPNRKSPRFFVINPISDRRFETRFESSYQAVIHDLTTDQCFIGFATGVGQRGARLTVDGLISVGDRLEISFPNSKDHVRCFGQVVWSTPNEDRSLFQSGVSVNAWYGVVNGPAAWKQFKGKTRKSDRRVKDR